MSEFDIIYSQSWKTHEKILDLRFFVMRIFESMQKNMALLSLGPLCKRFPFNRAWLAGTMVRALLGSTVGCAIYYKDHYGKTLDNADPNKRFDPENDCLMTSARENIMGTNYNMETVLSLVISSEQICLVS